MWPRIERLRNFLEQNKVLFETVAASLLSLMAIIVSVAQTRTASRQTDLLALQTSIAEAQALPQFEVGVHQRLNLATNKYDDDYLVITNRGGPVYDFHVDDAYSFVVEADVTGVGYRKVEIPVNGYFTASYVGASSVGDLVTMTGNSNNARFVALVRSTSDAASNRRWSFANVAQQLIVRLDYRDLLNRSHEDYFNVPTVGAGTRLDGATGKAFFERRRVSQPYEISELTAETILHLVSTTKARR